MKTILCILAALGLLGFLTIGGCAALTFFAISSALDIPEYAKEAYFTEQYGEDIRLVSRELSRADFKEPLVWGDGLHDDIVAVLRHEGNSQALGGETYTDVYGKYQVAKSSGHSIRNGIGIAKLKLDNVEESFLVKEITVEASDYWICFRTQKE